MTVVERVTDKVVEYLLCTQGLELNSIYISPNKDYAQVSLIVRGPDGFPSSCNVSGEGWSYTEWVFIFPERLTAHIEASRQVQFFYCDPEYWSKFCNYLQAMCYDYDH